MGTKVGRRIRKDATLSTEFMTRSTEINQMQSNFNQQMQLFLMKYVIFADKINNIINYKI